VGFDAFIELVEHGPQVQIVGFDVCRPAEICATSR
jgi:hypothetical protein